MPTRLSVYSNTHNESTPSLIGRVRICTCVVVRGCQDAKEGVGGWPHSDVYSKGSPIGMSIVVSCSTLFQLSFTIASRVASLLFT
jgi:hypothetical protein